MAQSPTDPAKNDSSCLPEQEIAAATRDSSTLPRGSKTICIDFDPQGYPELVRNSKGYQSHVDKAYAQHPELFPDAMKAGYQLHDRYVSAKLGICIRRIKLKATEDVYGICPSFVMPYMVGYTQDVLCDIR